jgi:hypothetical protein
MTGASAWVEQFPEAAIRDRALDELAGIEKYPLVTTTQASL